MFIKWSYDGNNFVEYWMPSKSSRGSHNDHYQNAFLKLMKLIYKGTFHSIHCSMMFWSAKIWSLQSRPFRNPTCSCLSLTCKAQSILLRRTLQKTFLGMDRSVMPCQWSQMLRSPLFPNLDIRLLLQSLGMVFVVPDLSKEISKHHGSCDDIYHE